MNCGMYVHTRAANFVLPGRYNLVTSSMVNIAWMKWFSKLTGRITRMVCIILLDTSLIDEVTSSRWMNLMNVRMSQIQSLKPVVRHIQVSSSDPKIASTHQHPIQAPRKSASKYKHLLLQPPSHFLIFPILQADFLCPKLTTTICL